MHGWGLLIFAALYAVKMLASPAPPTCLHEEMTFVSDEVTQDDIDYLATHLVVEYYVINNLVDTDQSFEAQIDLTNNGTVPISKLDWNMYFGFWRLLEPYRLPDDDGVLLGDSGMRAFHVNGYLFRMQPSDGFMEIQPGATLHIPIIGRLWHATRSDSIPNWFVVGGEHTTPKVITSTAGEGLEFVSPLVSAKQWKRYPHDTYNPYTAEERYTRYDGEVTGWTDYRVVPAVVASTLGHHSTNMINIGDDWLVEVLQDDLLPEAHYLADKLNIAVSPSRTGKVNSHHITLDLVPDLDISHECTSDQEIYTLVVNEEDETIHIVGSGRPGVFYGIQTLLSLAWPSRAIPVGDVLDCPRFGYRGLMMDVSRNFRSFEDAIDILDVMAMYKLNTLHLHLTDNDGWRLEIPGLEELTQIGAQRCYDPSGLKCVVPVLGSDPVSGGAGTGHYTIQQYKDILQYAHQLHIQVVPEFDMPGHAHAPIKAMEARFWALNTTDPEAAAEFLLSDFEDKSEYMSTALFTDNAINPCIESTYNFIEHVVQQVMMLHADIQPLAAFHFGGDEVPSGAWQQSPACEKFKESGAVAITATNAELKAYFVQRVSNITAKLGIGLAGWEDGFLNEGKPYPRDDLVNEDVYAYPWDNVWEAGRAGGAYNLANTDYKVILSHATHLYLDLCVEPDPEDPGLYWATRYVDTEQTFGYMPDRFYDNIDVDRAGNPITKEEICEKFGCPELVKPENILGIQSQIWTTITRTREQMDSMLFPRLVAMAERAWHVAAWEKEDNATVRAELRKVDWEDFSNVLSHHEFSHLDHLGIHYNIRPPGARIISKAGKSKIEVRPEFPGQPVMVSLDDGATWWDYDEDFVDWPDTVLLATSTTTRSRLGRALRLDGITAP